MKTIRDCTDKGAVVFFELIQALAKPAAPRQQGAKRPDTTLPRVKDGLERCAFDSLARLAVAWPVPNRGAA